MKQGRTLVLSVDRDDDIGFKGNIESPVIGRSACLAAANTLGLADPEDSDVNAIFQAVKIFDELKADGEDTEVAIIAGNHMHMIEGDRKIATSLDLVIQQTGADNCILVTDGAEDEYVLPIIQSRIPVTSIRRVVVSQIPNLEGTYYIIKKLLNDPKVARMVLIPIGLAMLLYAATYLLGAPQIAIILVVGAIGIYFLYRGIGLDDILRGFANALQTSLTRGRFSFVTYIAGILLIIIGIVMGLMSVLAHYSTEGTFGILLYILTFLYGGVLWMTLAGVVASVGIIIDHFFYEREGLVKVIVFPFFIAAIGLIAYSASVYVISMSNVADFPFTPESAFQYFVYGTVGGLICAFAGMGVRYMTSKWLLEQAPPHIIEVM
jgi:putative membrane protein